MDEKELNRRYNELFPDFKTEKIREAQRAYDEYKKRDCGTRVYAGDVVCKRAMYAMFNAYLDWICLSLGPRASSNHRRYINQGDRQRKDEINIIVREFNLS